MPILIHILEERLFSGIVCLENCSEILTDADLRGHFSLSVTTKDAALDHSTDFPITASRIARWISRREDFLCQVPRHLASRAGPSSYYRSCQSLLSLWNLLLLAHCEGPWGNDSATLIEILTWFTSLRDFLYVVLPSLQLMVGLFAHRHDPGSPHCWHLWLMWSVSSCS